MKYRQVCIPSFLSFLGKKDVWLLDDGLNGHRQQSIGLLDRLGIEDFTTVSLKPHRWGWFWGHFNNNWKWKVPEPPYPLIAIGAGKTAGYVLPLMKKHEAALFTVQLMRPHRPTWNYDVVIAGEHTDPLEAPNVLPVVTCTHGMSEFRVKAEAVLWVGRLPQLPRPWLFAAIGGTMHGWPKPKDWVWRLVNDLVDAAKLHRASLFVTTSRRTPEGLAQRLLSFCHLHHIPLYLHDVHKGDGEGGNPYSALLGLADRVIVTADSLSMVSEAVGSDKPVYVWGRKLLRRPKYTRFHEKLRELGRVADLGEAEPVDLTPLDETNRAAAFVCARYTQRQTLYASWPAELGCFPTRCD